MDDTPITPEPQPPAPPEEPVVITPINIAEDFGGHESGPSPARLALYAFAGLVVLAVLFMLVFHSRPPGKGTITKVTAVEQAPNVIVAIQVRFQNDSDKPITIKSIDAELISANGTRDTDHAAAASMLERYYQTFPSLRPDALDLAEPLKEEMKIPPKSAQIGVAIFAFPVDQATFDKRKSLQVKLGFYEREAEMVLQ